MAVRIRMKKMGRRHRPFFRLCAVDARGSRDGKVIEYLGHYDPMVKETDARAKLDGERIDYWLSVGAQPSDKVSVLIEKYGTNGTHLEQQKAAHARLEAMKPKAPPPMPAPAPPAEQAEAPEATVEATEESAPQPTESSDETSESESQDQSE